MVSTSKEYIKEYLTYFAPSHFPAEQRTPEDILNQAEIRNYLARCLATLSSHQELIIRQHIGFSGRAIPFSEISERLGITERAAKRYYKRGLQQLEEVIARHPFN